MGVPVKALRAPSEEATQMAVAEYLRHVEGPQHAPNFLWCHVPNGEDRHPAVASKLKAMGVKKGVWDLMFWGQGGQTYYIEMKRPTPTGKRNKPIETKLSEDQTTFKRDLTRLGFPVHHFAVADSAITVRAALLKWGLIS